MTKEERKLMTDNFIKMLDRIDEINKKNVQGFVRKTYDTYIKADLTVCFFWD